MMTSLIPIEPSRQALSWFLKQARPRKRRSMRVFAEAEIVLPSGPFTGRRFRCARQPYAGLFFDAVDSGSWSRVVATGPTQSGKTLCCFIIPVLYHLFEIGETVICGLPDMDMASDKWREDLLPVIEQSKYRNQLPTSGGGSRGGKVETIQFRNGATLKFMSGGGGDKSRAGFTSRVVVITETDGMDAPGRTSRESDKITQLEARTRAYGDRKRVYMECTVSTEQGRTWQEYTQGTKSRIVLPCGDCGAWVTPEREHLTGWDGAESMVAAKRTGAFACPVCGVIWSTRDRVVANEKSRLLHDGQDIDEAGAITGDPPATNTLGFRWSAVNNLLVTPGELAADSWRAARSPDIENADREMKQFIWCLPVAPTKLSETNLQVTELAARVTDHMRGIVPMDARRITAGIDLGKYLAHWIVVAWSEQARGHVVDYGRLEVPSDGMAVEQALVIALREASEMMTSGWPRSNPEGQKVIPQQVYIDAGYMTEVVYDFCRNAGDRFRPSIGRGAAQQRSQWHQRVTQTGSVVKMVGEGYHVNWLPTERIHLVEIDADYWKSWLHLRLATPMGQPGAMSLFRGHPQEHLSLAHHLTAEARTEEFIAGKGVVTRWERQRKQNHWLDALYLACTAGHGCGVRLLGEEPGSEPAPRRRATIRFPGQENYVEAGRARGSKW